MCQISNIADRCYVGLHVALESFGPLLKPRSQNPKAALLMLFMNAVEEAVGRDADDIEFKACLLKARNYIKLDPLRDTLSRYSQGRIMLIYTQDMFRDVGALFGKYMEVCHMVEIELSFDMRIRSENSIVDQWPYRIHKDATQEEFEERLIAGVSGSERYLEWVRI